MITTPGTTSIGGTSQQGMSAPGAIVIGGQSRVPPDTIFIQNDSATVPSSPWYVSQVDAAHYTMPNATAPKGWQYIGAFIVDGKKGGRGGRADGAVWTISDPTVVQLISVSAAGQAAISILTPGTSTLTVSLRGMTSTLVITAV